MFYRVLPCVGVVADHQGLIPAHQCADDIYICSFFDFRKKIPVGNVGWHLPLRINGRILVDVRAGPGRFANLPWVDSAGHIRLYGGYGP